MAYVSRLCDYTLSWIKILEPVRVPFPERNNIPETSRYLKQLLDSKYYLTIFWQKLRIYHTQNIQSDAILVPTKTFRHSFSVKGISWKLFFKITLLSGVATRTELHIRTRPHFWTGMSENAFRWIFYARETAIGEIDFFELVIIMKYTQYLVHCCIWSHILGIATIGDP